MDWIGLEIIQFDKEMSFQVLESESRCKSYKSTK